MAVQHLCEHESASVMACLTEEALGLRYGGVGIRGVVEIARSVHPHGWAVSRVLRGTTRRERRDDEILHTIGEGADEIWRLVMEKDGVKGEIVFMESLSPEGRAALPQLLRILGIDWLCFPWNLMFWHGTEIPGGPSPLVGPAKKQMQ